MIKNKQKQSYTQHEKDKKQEQVQDKKNIDSFFGSKQTRGLIEVKAIHGTTREQSVTVLILIEDKQKQAKDNPMKTKRADTGNTDEPTKTEMKTLSETHRGWFTNQNTTGEYKLQNKTGNSFIKS